MPLIRGKQITALEITARELGPLAVETAKIDDLAVTEAKLDDLSVATAKIQALSVTNGKIANTTITEGKLAASLETTLIRVDGSQAFLATQSMGGFALTSVLDPVSAQDAATKSYVDGVASGLDVKESCRAATTGDLSNDSTAPSYNDTGGASGRGQITFSVGPSAIDVVTLADGDRILVKDELGALGEDAHGIWVRTSVNTWDRATDFDEDAEVTAGAFTFIEEGTTNGDNGFVLTTDDPITIGGASGTSLTFVQFSGAGQITAGTGLSKSGNTINAIGGQGITANANSLDLDLASGGGLKIVGIEVAVEPNDFAGTGLEDDGSDNLRIAASAAGAGLTGGAGSALAVGAGTGITVAADTVSFDATAADGNGLTGAGAVLTVGQGVGITVGATDVAVAPAKLIQGGDAELDGDFLDIDFEPVNYTEETGTVGGVGSVLDDHLTAHLGGIDTKLGNLSAGGAPRQEAVTTQTVTNADTALSDTLNATPVSNASLTLFLNGVLQEQGATKDYTISGITITWLPSSGSGTGTAVDMDTSDVLVAVYEE